MRCKVICTWKDTRVDGVYLYFSAVVNGSEENKEFFKYTPGGQVSFALAKQETADKFEVGKEYYLDFSPAEVN